MSTRCWNMLRCICRSHAAAFAGLRYRRAIGLCFLLEVVDSETLSRSVHGRLIVRNGIIACDGARLRLSTGGTMFPRRRRRLQSAIEEAPVRASGWCHATKGGLAT